MKNKQALVEAFSPDGSLRSFPVELVWDWTYYWLYIPTGETGTRFVKFSMLEWDKRSELLAQWNKANPLRWKYWD